MLKRKRTADWGTPLGLVLEGKPRAAVILPDGASQVLQAAAEDLVRVIEKMSGARLPLVADEAQTSLPVRIRLGSSQAAALGIPLDGVGLEGHRVRRVRNRLVIAGVTDEGTAHGIYTLLQDSLGVRWLMPGDMWEIVPRRKTVSVNFWGGARNPSFLYRVYSGVTDPRWCARNRLTYDASRLPYYGHGHNLKNIIKPSLYGKKHPEYFAEIGGKRFVPASDSDERSQPCFTNPDVIRITVQAARAFFDSHPERTTFSLCTNDNMDYCTCAKCSALDAPPRMYRNEPVHSDSYFYFVSQVAKEVAKSHPDRYLACYAYWGTDSIPRRIRRLPENVAIMLTQDTSQHFDPAYRKEDRAILSRWTKVAAHVGKYDYYGLGWLTPRCFPTLAGADLRFCRQQGVVGIYNEVYPYWAITGPMVWLSAQMMWNAEADPAALLEEFVRLAFFGRACVYMRAFYQTLEEIWCQPRGGMWFQGLDKMRYETATASGPLMKRAWALVEDASKRALGEAGARVAYVRSGFEMSYLLATIHDDARSLAEKTIEQEIHVHQVLQGALDVLGRLDEPMRSFEKHVRDDPAYAHVYFRPDRFPHKMQTWREEIGELLGIALRRALIWARGNLHPREIDAFRQEITTRFADLPAAGELGLTDVVAA